MWGRIGFVGKVVVGFILLVEGEMLVVVVFSCFFIRVVFILSIRVGASRGS